jgi:DNA-binding XRE family transcriptional regulator
MATSELLHNVRSMSPAEQALSMAVAVLMDRLTRLSNDDRGDLLALLKEMVTTENEAERGEIAATMLEIFESRSSAIEAAGFGDDEKRSEGLKKWAEYVSRRVREAREAFPMTQEELSEKTGLPQSHISRIENARLSPSRLTIEKIATALGKTVADFDCVAERPAGSES